MSLPRLWAFLAVALPSVAVIVAGLSSVDLAYHLRAGAEILDTRAIPTVDGWTFTAAGLPWTDQQWGAQVILATAYRLAGWTGLVLLRVVLVGVIFGCLLAIGLRRGLGLRAASLLTLAAFLVSSPALALRPQLIGMALFAVVLVLVAGRREHPRWLWAVPPIVLLWANVHGSFFLGPLVVGLAWLEDLHAREPAARGTLAVALASGLAACVTPFGPAVWAYAVGLTTNAGVTSRITEWQPTSLRDVAGLLFYGSAAAIAVYIARRGRVIPWPTIAWLGVFLVIGAYAARGVAWWSLAAVPVVASLLPAGESSATPRETPMLQRLNVVLAAATVVAGIAFLPAWRPIDAGLETPADLVADAPPGLTRALHEFSEPGDRLFNPQPWGSWFEFAMPQLPVAIDSRIELFPVQVWDDYGIVANGADGWEGVLRDWRVTLIALASDDRAARDRLTEAGWRVIFGDASGVLLRAP